MTEAIQIGHLGAVFKSLAIVHESYCKGLLDIRRGFDVNLGRNSTLCRNRKDGPNQVFRWNQD